MTLVIRKPGSAGERWRVERNGLTVLLVSLVAIGVVMTIAGTVGDLRGWWSEKPFLTNLASGIASAGFGIPFAVVILRKLLMRQQLIDEWAARRRTGQQPLVDALGSFQDLLRDLKHGNYRGGPPLKAAVHDFEAASNRWSRWIGGDKPYIWIGTDMSRYSFVSHVTSEINEDLSEVSKALQQLERFYGQAEAVAQTGPHADDLGRKCIRFADRLVSNVGVVLALSRLEAHDEADLKRQFGLYVLRPKIAQGI